MTPSRSLRVLMLAVTLAVVALARCSPRLPPVSGCAPLTRRCAADRIEVCSPTQRWHQVGDEACRDGCELLDSGVVRCAARDGGVE